jgi:PTH1 family peptidyl-tRNA hydrolase
MACRVYKKGRLSMTISSSISGSELISLIHFMSISVIVGLGNPGEKYAATRHNVGFWLLDRLVADAGTSLKAEKKVMGEVGQGSIGHSNVRLMKPSTYMNESGQPVRRILDFYKLEPEQLLVIHDEIDLLPGTIKLKKGGGHGGHNGLRDIISHCGKDFMRMRIGVGHPGHKSQVTNFVLKPPGKAEQALIEDALPDAQRAVGILLQEGPEKAMHFLHTD